MEKLNYKYQKLIRSQDACQRALSLYKNPRPDATEGELEAYTASVIKHFELFYEMLWKFLKYYLAATHGSEAKGSKTVFREIHTHGLINNHELDRLLAIVENRNTTTHVYDEQTARSMCNEILIDFPIMKNIVVSLQGSINTSPSIS
jgi:nucleotidyltransferase substrate binding protein (TIGR01987 family)